MGEAGQENLLRHWDQADHLPSPSIDLPTDHPRPAVASGRRLVRVHELTEARVAGLERLCLEHEASLSLGLASLVGVVLQRYARLDAVPLAIAHAPGPGPGPGLNQEETRRPWAAAPERWSSGRTPGLDLLVVDGSGNPGFRELLSRMSKEVLKAPTAPSHPERDVAAPQVLVALVEQAAESAGPEAAESLTGPHPGCDLALQGHRHPDGLTVRIDADADLFSAERIDRLAGHLGTLLEGVLADPERSIHRLPMLTAPEAEQLTRWSQGPALALPQLCMHQLFEQQVQRTPHAIALLFGDQQLTYSDLNARANRLAHHLIARGVGPERIVALALERSIELIVALLAILKAGGAYLPLDPALPPRRLAQILEDAAPALVISSRRSVASIQASGVIAADALLTIPIAAGDAPEDHGMASASPPARQGCDPAANPGRPQDPASAAYLLYTSGTSGTPKGVLIEHGALVARTIDLLGRLRLDPAAVVLAHTALSFDISIVEVLMPLTGGARLVLTTEEQQRDPAALIQLVNDQRITLLQATPSQWQVLLRSGYSNQPQILAIAGGETLPPALAEAIRRHSGALINGYGPTEVTIYASMQTVDADSAVGIGKPLANTSALVLDRHGHPCPIGIAGELFLSGCGVARCYRNRAELTRERFVSMPLPADRSNREAATRLYATGDLAHWNPDGTLVYLGRLDQQIKLRGFRIEPGDIASHLLAHPGVAQAVVVLRNDDPANPRLIAYWVPQEASRSAATPLAPNPWAGAPAAVAPGTAAPDSAAAAGVAKAAGGEVAAVISEPVAAPAADTASRAIVVVSEQDSDPATAAAPDASAPGAEELRQFLAERLPPYMVPAAFVALEALPLTSNGKLDRNALPPPSFSGDQEQRVEPSTDLERQLHALWAEVLGHPDFGINDNFFHIGGHSLAAARLVARMQQVLAIALPVATLFAHPTIASLLKAAAHRLGSESIAAIPGATPLQLDGRDAWPASFSQARLWFLHQLEPELIAYHMPSLWQLQGDLDSVALAQAFERLLERQPTLRTAFRLHDGQLLQVPQPAGRFILRRRTLPPPAKPAAPQDPPTDATAAFLDHRPLPGLDDLIRQEIATPFDLSEGPLLRALLIQISPQEHRLLITVHHIASDGWSQDLLLLELAAHYRAALSSSANSAAASSSTPATPPLPPLPVSYADFSQWQRQALSGEGRQQLVDYWRQQLRDLAPLDLPSDHPRPAVLSHRGNHLSCEISSSSIEAFEQLCRSEGATLQMGFLALIALLLQRYSRSDDIALAVPHWGRSHPDLEGLIGFFINTLVLRCDLSGAPSFRDLLRRLRDTSLDAYAHQDLPFEEVVELLQPARDRSRHPLTGVLVQLLDFPDPDPFRLQGLEVHQQDLPCEQTRLDLEFTARRQQEGLTLDIFYATDLFSAERIDRLAGHLATLLEGVLADPEQSIHRLPMLTATEAEQLARWSQGPALALPELCVHQLFEQQVKRTPHAIALVFSDQQLTYSDLNARANQLAHHLIARGVGPDVIVALALERSIELIVALLAILKAGGAYLPLDPAWPAQRLRQILEDAAPSALISAAGWLIPGGGDRAMPLLLLDDPALGLEHQPADPPDASRHFAHQLAYLTYTSGSTGVPKGVLIEHRGILRLLDPANPYRIHAGDRVLQLAPQAFDAATFEIWGALLNGATLVLAPPAQLSLLDLAGLLHQQRITTLWLTAGLFHAMADAEPQALAGVRQILAGGDVLAPGVVQRLLDQLPAGHRLINGYGPSESTTFTCCHALAASDGMNPSGVPIGRPIAATIVRVLDRQGHPCPIGVPGELQIGGIGLARGYLNNPELTAATFIADPFSTDPTARLYRSDDLVSWNPDGTLTFQGRLDQQIKLRGFRIEPGEIEAALLHHPAVMQAAVVLRRDDPANPRLIAYWVPQEASRSAATPLAPNPGAGAPAAVAPGTAVPDAAAGVADAAGGEVAVVVSEPEAAPAAAAARDASAAPGSEELRQFLAERLPDSMVPGAFVALEALPLTANGKLDRNALPAPSFSGEEQRLEPSTPLQRLLQALWAEILGHSDFGISDNFFLVGGHSLAAARLVARLAELSGHPVPIALLFQHPTIAALAALLDDGSRPQTLLEPGHRSGAVGTADWSHPATAASGTGDPAGAVAGTGSGSWPGSGPMAASTRTSLSAPAAALVPLQPQGRGPALFVVHGWGGDVFAHIGLAQALTPHRRQVHGLQAIGFDGSQPRQGSVEAMAAHYAQEILCFQPEGPYHLLGFSAGSWYAWAVAAELQRAGATIGLVGLIDPGPTSRLHKRLVLRHPPLLISQWNSRLHLGGWWLRGVLNAAGRRARGLVPSRPSPLLQPRPDEMSLTGSSSDRSIPATPLTAQTWDLDAGEAHRCAPALRARLRTEARLERATASTTPAQSLRTATDRWRLMDYYIERQNTYRPPRLPLPVHVFCTEGSARLQAPLWRFYSGPKPVIEPFYKGHHDYLRHGEAMERLADRLEGLMGWMETRSGMTATKPAE